MFQASTEHSRQCTVFWKKTAFAQGMLAARPECLHQRTWSWRGLGKCSMERLTDLLNGWDQRLKPSKRLEHFAALQPEAQRQVWEELGVYYFASERQQVCHEEYEDGALPMCDGEDSDGCDTGSSSEESFAGDTRRKPKGKVGIRFGVSHIPSGAAACIPVCMTRPCRLQRELGTMLFTIDWKSRVSKPDTLVPLNASLPHLHAIAWRAKRIAVRWRAQLFSAGGAAP